MLTRKQILHLAKLANLSLKSKEIEKFRFQLNQVLAYMEQLKKIETEGVEPTSQVTGLENIFRADEVEVCLSQKEALSGSKNNYQGRIKVKAVLQK